MRLGSNDEGASASTFSPLRTFQIIVLSVGRLVCVASQELASHVAQ